MTNKYKDLLGKEIKVGDFITYAANDGRCGVLRVGQVTELTQAKEKDYFTNKKKSKIKVKSARWGCNDVWLRQKDVFLEFFGRLIVVDNLPEEVRNMLKD